MSEEWVVVIEHETTEDKHPAKDSFPVRRWKEPKLGSGCLPFFVEMCAIFPALIVFALGLIAVFF